ncbi:hypothetical protein GCM10027084_02210 [Pseudoxanthomonas sangjuensis]|uniref:hypothetical protein n=1 Tax=Pseudoxanthomonas sangjuensis TaxID=1503750 RepID=UPI001390850E|nr:hypothetical protein [Pseudoxanthomonas sangjuensis]KAF1713894.1 hypothetical protein CSC71_05820 [Pseudoxanthomonas sangjuensis]
MEQIAFEGPGYRIATTDKAETMTHYHGMSPEELAAYGHDRGAFVDLISSPELIDTIPELRRSAGLRSMVAAATGHDSKLCSIGCDVAQFERTADDNPIASKFHVGGYAVYVIRNPEKSTDTSHYVDLAGWILGAIPAPPPPIRIFFDFMVEPLKHFYGEQGHFGLMAKTVGYGDTPELAWRSFEWSSNQIAASIMRHRVPPESPSGQTE